jgi:phosphoribosylformylglycinamidine synthase
MTTIHKPALKLEPMVDVHLALEHGLSKAEYHNILEILGRTPTFTELGMYSVMWSEHCSYKNSIAELKKLPRSGNRLLVSAGEENAGLVDIGDGLAVAFKIESHNHPSAVEPYQGAATGVGGILRDIFSMGARPIAVLNSLRFGNLDDPKTRQLFKGVVKGIADYGNSFGVPTVAGEIYFEKCYGTNPLVNAMAIGIVEHGKVSKAIATGAGNSVMIVGSSTGRDGIHGATFASEELSEKSEAKRPAVQVGDPFTEKLLLEATLEAIATGHIVGIQDMGAAGITCSTTEMSAKGSFGMRINLNKVPLREAGMTAYEILLSESQERMLFIVAKGFEASIDNIFKKWDLHSEVIGTVEEGDEVEYLLDGKILARVPAESLVLGGGAPVYTPPAIEPKYISEVRNFNPNSIPIPKDYNSILLRLLSSPSIAGKRYAFEQYDSMVRTNNLDSVRRDAAVVRIKGTKKAIVASVDCNARFVYLNPRRGAAIAVAESARNVACTGAIPIALTNCLNFGNPNDPQIYWQFKEAIAGISEACRRLQTPVTGGNVSFYNESTLGAVYPTPVIGMLGLLEDVSKRIPTDAVGSGELVGCWSLHRGEVGGSHYQSEILGEIRGDAPQLDLEFEHRLQLLLIECANMGYLSSVHDVSEGGLAVAVSEMLFNAEEGIGYNLHNIDYDTRPDFELFGESQSMAVCTFSQHHLKDLSDLSERFQVPFRILGGTTNDSVIRIGSEIRLSRDQADSVFKTAIEKLL